MDFISDKIEYSNIRPARGNMKLQDLKFTENYSVALDLDADIEIIINDNCIFDCPMTPILELYLQFKKWSMSNYNSSFSYNSLESSGIIFEIKNENNKWYFISEFTTTPIHIEIDINRIKIIIDAFMKNFEEDFNKLFPIKIWDLLKHYL